MKKLFLSLIFTPFLLFAQSIYPLPFTFDDSDLYVGGIGWTELTKDKHIDKPFYFELLNVSGNPILIILPDSSCLDIKTTKELFNYKSSECPKWQKSLNSDYRKDLDIVTDDLHIYVFENNLVIFAFVAKGDKIIGNLRQMSKREWKSDRAFFFDILKTVRINKNIKGIDDYIKAGNQAAILNTKDFNLFTATKNLVSAMILDPNHSGVKELYQKIHDIKKAELEMLWSDPNLLSNNQTKTEVEK